jgi:tRNA 2-thiouridine synthesizing protein A
VTPDADAQVDARGAACPVPVIRLARAARGHRPGDRLLLLADDPAARADVPAWCRMRGHTVTATERAGHTAYLVVLGDPPLRPG